LRPSDSNWQKAIWKLLANPALELVATIALVMVATWFLIQNDGVQQGVQLPFFGHR
jgi:hypothetical protein